MIPAPTWLLLVAALGAAATPAKPGGVAEPPQVAVQDVELGPGATDADQAALTGVLARSLADREAWRVTPVRDLAALLGAERRRQLLGCSVESCLTELAADLGSDGVVITSVGQVGGQLVAAGRVTASRGGSAMARATVQVVGHDLTRAIQALGAALRRAYRQARGLSVGGEADDQGAATGADCLGAAGCETECRAGSPAACARLGNQLGADATRPLRAAASHGRACDLGDVTSCLTAARALQAHAFHREALPFLQRACGADGPGRAEACRRAGQILLHARQLERDLDQGLTLLRAGCERDDGAACLEFGEALDAGEAKGRDEAAAGWALEGACRLGHAKGCLALASRAEQGRGMPPDLARAAALRQSACDHGSAETCVAIGRVHLDAGNARRALQLWLDVCHGASREAAPACTAAAEIQVDGPASVRDPVQGRATARLSCTKGDAAGCLLAGTVAARQERPDWVEARRLLERGCAGRNQPCGRTLAALVTRLPESFTAFAMTKLDAACSDGVFEACHGAAVMLGSGRGVPKDTTRIRRYEELSCRAGGGADCHAWGRWLENRMRDEAEFLGAYQIGCRARSGPCCARLAELTASQSGVSRRSPQVLALRKEACQYGMTSFCD